MPRRLKVFRAHLGFYDSIVAAPSQKAAAEAWGADVREFAQGFASVTKDKDSVTAACAQPGIVLRRPAGSRGAFTTRTLKQGTNALNYNLYTDPALTLIWGDGTGGTNTYTKGNPPNSVDVNVTIYGRVPPLQDARVGAYTDSIVATINF